MTNIIIPSIDRPKISHYNRHIGFIYSSEQEWKEIVLDFLTEGLKNNDKCICIASTDTNLKIERILLESKIESLSHQLLFASMEKEFTRENRLDPFLVITFLMDQYKEAIDKDHFSVRCLFEMDTILNQRSALFDLEVRLNRYCLPLFPCVILCLHDLNKLNYRNIWEIFVNHPWVNSGMRILKNPYYIEPRVFFDLQDGQFIWQVMKRSIESGREYPL